jgi:hypothetical protein
MRRLSLVLCLALIASGFAAASPARAAVPNPTLTGPVEGGIHGYPLWDSWYDLTELGYEEAEYFVSGTARSADGATAEYTTRIIVTRPSSPRRFNGNVMLDWVNVTAQFENAVDTVEAHEYLLRTGWAYVHVSAQEEGVCCNPLTPVGWDPVRYADLNHPGDDFANDIFSQVARALDAPRGIDPLAGLARKRKLIAAGQSLSAIRLSDYVRTAQRAAGIIDGFLIHSGGSREFARPPSVPVLHLMSDAEASTEAANQTRNYRLWEIAGSSHSDFWVGYHQEVGMGPRFLGAPKQPPEADEDMHAVAGNYGEQPHPMHPACILAGGSFPLRYSVSAALHHLSRWVRRGLAPPRGPRFRMDGETLARDEHGNALGGIRLPPIDVPVATYESDRCVLGGYTVPFTSAQLLLLYPTHADYMAKMRARTMASVRAGFLLPEDAEDLLARACAARSRWPEPGAACGSEIPYGRTATPQRQI